MKTKLNDKLQSEICKYIEAGSYIKVACQAVGIDEQTYYDWLQKAERDKKRKVVSIYTQFAQSAKKAEAKAEVKNIAIIEKAAIDTWQAAAWYLERKYRNRWGQRSEIEHKGNVEINIKVEGV